MAQLSSSDLLNAIDAPLAGHWDRAHQIVQQDDDNPLACWIHAVPHKIEGDASNSRYWYMRTGNLPTPSRSWPPLNKKSVIQSVLRASTKGGFVAPAPTGSRVP
ncbi:MAG: hypothetical protein ACYC9L_12265 [Sulfuricaulis sp.]